MPIVNVQKQIIPTSPTTKFVIVDFIDQDANQYRETFHAPNEFDDDAKIAVRRAELDEQLAQQEFEAIVGGG